MRIYNTLTRQTETFIPKFEKKVSLYVCGITPYDTTHLGHAFTYIFFDALFRYLEHKGNSVIYTQNVTDINDRDNDLLNRAKEQNISWQDLAAYWTGKFLSDMKALNWKMPTHYLNASRHIDQIIKVTEQLLINGVAYKKEGSVFLDISKVRGFGSLSGLSESEMLKTAKKFEEDISNKSKLHPLDITLWRAAEKTQGKHIPSFDSPFGKGRPGWHIECSAMALSSLGDQIDIHGGGIDLIFPHHESEIAQSENATKKYPFAKYWLHSGQVNHLGKKMSKSTGNLVLVSDLLKTYSPNAIRWLLLSHHFQENWEYKEEELQLAEKKLYKIFKNTSPINSFPSQQHNKYLKIFEEKLENNMDTSQALLYIEDLADISTKSLNSQINSAVRAAMKILGFSL